MDTGFPFLTRTFRVYHREDKIIANASGTPFLLIPETFSVMALAFDSSIFFLLSDILPRLRHHSSRDPRMCCRTIPRFPAAELITPIKSTKPFPVRHRSTTNDEYRAPRRDKSATQKKFGTMFFQAIRRPTQSGRHKKTKGSRPGRAPQRLTTTRDERARGGEVDMVERGTVLGLVDGPMQRRVLNQPASEQLHGTDG